jgi:hypothetical protein
VGLVDVVAILLPQLAERLDADRQPAPDHGSSYRAARRHETDAGRRCRPLYDGTARCYGYSGTSR